MQHYIGETYCFCDEREHFQVEEADRLFFICRFKGTQEGFVMEKEVFDRQFRKGRIVKQMASVAV
ncbi:MAG: hypothetical protein H0Z33_10455 [Bacillaceae bacterium]|nr:hypothetical protein [Bacillaceae bacterium]